MSKRPTLGKGLGDLGLSELLGDLNPPTVSVLEVDDGTRDDVDNTSGAHVSPQTSEALEAEVKTSTADEEKVEATSTTDVPVKSVAPSPHNASLKSLPVDLLMPGRYQPRRNFDESALQELADSIKAQGIIQPIVVRRMNGRYEIIAGERRWRAAQLAGLSDVPVVEKDLTDEAALAMSLIENIQRKDLNVVEEAEALDRLIREFQLTHQEVAQAVGKSRTGVTNLLRLLKLNPEARSLLEQGKIEMGHARALLGLQGGEQTKVAQAIVARELSVRQTEVLIRRVHEMKSVARGEKQKPDPDVLRLQNDLAEKLGAGIRIQHSAQGKGRVLIQYNSIEELQGILEHIH